MTNTNTPTNKATCKTCGAEVPNHVPSLFDSQGIGAAGHRIFPPSAERTLDLPKASQMIPGTFIDHEDGTSTFVPNATPEPVELKKEWEQLRETIRWAVTFEYAAPHNKHKSMQDVIDTIEYQVSKVINKEVERKSLEARIEVYREVIDNLHRTTFRRYIVELYGNALEELKKLKEGL
mgnify:FL=1